MRKGLFLLSDKQWVRIAPHLPTNLTGPERDDDRRIISGIVHMLQSGARWRDLRDRPPGFADSAASCCFSSTVQRRRRSTGVITSTIVLCIKLPYAQHFARSARRRQGSHHETLTQIPINAQIA
jgi:transposase